MQEIESIPEFTGHESPHDAGKWLKNLVVSTGSFSESGILRFVALHFASGSPARAWFKALDEDLKNSWDQFQRQFEDRWIDIHPRPDCDDDEWNTFQNHVLTDDMIFRDDSATKSSMKTIIFTWARAHLELGQEVTSQDDSVLIEATEDILPPVIQAYLHTRASPFPTTFVSLCTDLTDIPLEILEFEHIRRQKSLRLGRSVLEKKLEAMGSKVDRILMILEPNDILTQTKAPAPVPSKQPMTGVDPSMTAMILSVPSQKPHTSAQPSGTRDGDFVVFKGWDMPASDVVYYPDLANNLEQLKKAALETTGLMINAFNTSGWMKSCECYDISKWTRSFNSDLYVRVEYPGWHFIQGVDSPGNDIENSPIPINVPPLLAETITHWTKEKLNRVAGFNTNGWVKTHILSDLVPFSPFPLDGLYVRTDFRDYAFFQHFDSDGNDISFHGDIVNNVPRLISTNNGYKNGAGFNTNGCIKHSMVVPPPHFIQEFNSPTKGAYVRVEWPGFTFLPKLDAGDGDLKCMSGKVWELIEAARMDPKILAFNTNGWMKSDLVNMPVDVPTDPQSLYGIYVKTPKLSSSGVKQDLSFVSSVATHQVNNYLFALKGAAIIWGDGLLFPPKVRAEYLKAISAMSHEILDQMHEGTLTPEETAMQAQEIRVMYLETVRTRASPIGLSKARSIKPVSRSYARILDKCSTQMYGKAFGELTSEEASRVSVSAIESTPRANKSVTNLMQRLGMASRALVVVCMVLSVYECITRSGPEEELKKQLSSWFIAISQAKIGAGVGAIFDPIGAVVGGIAGGIVGGVTEDVVGAQLREWFLGGSSTKPARHILGLTLDMARERVKRLLDYSKKLSHSHQVHESLINGEDIADNVEKMISTPIRDRADGNKILATVHWLQTSDGIVPINPANPADFIILMDWVGKKRPLAR